jgi:cellulose synthase/poly-beta-1,6-N-acetylglucosamine synthase-like glycosyltransferase
MATQRPTRRRSAPSWRTRLGAAVGRSAGTAHRIGSYGVAAERAAGRPADERDANGGGPTISVVIPTLNEAANLPHVLARLPSSVDEVVLVDGHSVDDTIEVARAIRADVRVILQSGRGKGNALACGFAAARGEIIVMLDADASNDPAEITRFV